MARTSTSPRTDVRDTVEYRKTDRWLVWAVTLFAVAVLLHNSDHARRGVDSMGRDVFVVGSSAIILEVGIAVLIYRRHRWAPLAAAVIGFSLGAGYLVVHFLPHRSWLSDSFISAANVRPLSWGAASLETVSAIILGVAGLVALRRRGGLASAGRPSPDQRSLRAVAVHPVVVVLVVVSAAILAVSVAQL